MDLTEPFGGLVPGVRGAVLGVLLRTGEPLTGRQVHALVRERHSLWSVQESLKDLVDLGVVRSQSIGRARVNSVNVEHVFVTALLPLVSPLAVLRSVVAEGVDSDVDAVVLFGSMARGEATRHSDIDLMVIAKPGWSRAAELQEAIHNEMGNACDIIVLTAAEFTTSAEPVLKRARREGIAVLGSKPRTKKVA